MASTKLGLIGSPPAPSSPVANAKLQSQTVANLKSYCDRWTNVFRGLSGELRVLSDSYIKWMSYDQSSQLQTAGSKWTREEEDLLRYAVSIYGDDMPKICETLNSRSEQAIRAAIKRKVDPAVLESIGPKRKKKGHIAEDTSPLASYTSNGSAEANSADEESDSRVEPTSGSSSEQPKSTTGWFLQDAGVELTDHDFLTLLEEDQTILEGGMSMAGIPQIPSIRSPDEFKPEHMLVERATTAQDFIFLNNYKADMRQIADDLRVHRAKSIKTEKDAVSSAPTVAKTQILLNGAHDPSDPDNEAALAQLEQILFGGHQDYNSTDEQPLAVPGSSSTEDSSSEMAQITAAVDHDQEAATAAQFIEGLM
ncbi:hypothetical protein RvY_05278 [Ramazzottius varieornatus]|uniref:Myb-like domain-containing protein n=1 Tax=Ramazzottius varieornatus TaxID=947166 RepID=A0A1D1V165_RAMVA|nr:hypothetical protein RvY_05278 [Ramazzottius varieornatus]